MSLKKKKKEEERGRRSSSRADKGNMERRAT